MKYLDKTFFKFTFGFLFIICVSLIVIVATSKFIENEEAQIANPSGTQSNQ